MDKAHEKYVLDMMEQVRKLSFRFSNHEQKLQCRQKKLDAIKAELKNTANLTEEYQKKSEKLSHKMSRMKSITRD